MLDVYLFLIGFRNKSALMIIITFHITGNAKLQQRPASAKSIESGRSTPLRSFSLPRKKR